VVKADGLAGGKGVTVCDGPDAAEAAIRDLYADRGDARVIIEERLVGREASVIALTDGRALVALPPARDHKRLLDDDVGPNTGGMGASSPLPDLSDDEAGTILETIHRPLVAELARRGTPFRGALYAGLMLTDDGPFLLECNARFGDPETQVILPRLATALGPLLLSAARGSLGDVAASIGERLPVLGIATVGIVLAAAGYPDTPRRGDPIEGLERSSGAGGHVFHAATRREADAGWVTDGGRILTAVGEGADLAAARAAAESIATGISFAGLHRRTDIGLDPASRPAIVAAGR
jgi:phosphoribosylamine--glycine ligase